MLAMDIVQLVRADGLITPAKVGTTTVTATVGGAVLTITVRIK